MEAASSEAVNRPKAKRAEAYWVKGRKACAASAASRRLTIPAWCSVAPQATMMENTITAQLKLPASRSERVSQDRARPPVPHGGPPSFHHARLQVKELPGRDGRAHQADHQQQVTRVPFHGRPNRMIGGGQPVRIGQG